MVRRWNGWVLAGLLLALVVWLTIRPNPIVEPMTKEIAAGCYGNGPTGVVLRSDGTMQAGEVEARYYVVPGIAGSRPDVVVPQGVVPSGAGGGLTFTRSDAPARWYINRDVPRLTIPLEQGGMRHLQGRSCGEQTE